MIKRYAIPIFISLVALLGCSKSINVTDQIKKPSELILSTQELILKRYDTRDMIRQSPNFGCVDIRPNKSVVEKSYNTWKDTCWDIKEYFSKRKPSADDLANLITAKIRNEIWDETKGTAIFISQGQLLVVAPTTIQNEIKVFLDSLREKQHN